MITLDVKIDQKKIQQKLQHNIRYAQFFLDTEVMTCMKPYMPRVTGTFSNLTETRSRAWAGTGKVCAGAPPYGRYLYYGKKMVDSLTGKGPMKIETSPGEFILRYKLGARLKPTDKPLRYTYPMARPEWFEVAKANFLQNWIKLTEDKLNGK